MFKGLYEACKGFLITGNASITSDSNDPTGTPANQSSLHLQNIECGSIWLKFGPNDEDWRQLSLADVETRYVWSNDLCMALDDNLCPVVAD